MKNRANAAANKEAFNRFIVELQNDIRGQVQGNLASFAVDANPCPNKWVSPNTPPYSPTTLASNLIELAAYLQNIDNALSLCAEDFAANQNFETLVKNVLKNKSSILRENYSYSLKTYLKDFYEGTYN